MKACKQAACVAQMEGFPAIFRKQWHLFSL
ncbi:MAG: hypothetical protein QOC70_254 [Verrucomicrobiota bacterium]|jgi:hypothetical protein